MTVYLKNDKGVPEFFRSRGTYGGEIDYPWFSVEGEPLEAYYKIQEFT